MQLISPTPAATETTSSQPPRRSRQSALRRMNIILLFLLPSAIIYIVFVFLPIIQAAYYSLYRWNGLVPLSDFVWLKNYQLALSNKIFLGSIGHNLLILVLSLLIQLPFSLLIALVIGKTLPGRTFFRTVFFMPYILSDVIAGLIWQFIYRPDSGLNVVLQHVIPGYQAQLWLADPKIVLPSIFLVMIWKYFGFHMVLYVAALQNIPDEIDEAARIDGASGLQIMRFIHIPLLGNTIRLTILISALGSLQYFDLIWIMSLGGPVHGSETMTTYLFKYGFQSFALGYGSAVGVILFALCFIFAIMYQRFIMAREVEGSLTEAAA
jgi:raffinose/stachyose/melibiose transport system permease protein